MILGGQGGGPVLEQEDKRETSIIRRGIPLLFILLVESGIVYPTILQIET